MTTTPLTATTALPARCMKLAALLWHRGTDDIVKLTPAGQDDLALGAYAAQAWDSSYTPKYRPQGPTSIRWYPIPTQAYTLTCVYSAFPADLVADGDPFDAYTGFEEWVIADVCRKIAEKEEKPTQGWLNQRNDVEARIRTQAAQRDEGEAKVLRDVYSPYGDLGLYERWNIASRY